MKHFILGTAGHVDHGKSSLIQALTNVNTDRLPEEQERGLSIDLGFAPLLLEAPNAEGEGIHLGVVDVPGHQRFLRNMIAWVGGFDAALLVVDCREGVKPQTEEHLKILSLLETRKGVVALSKVDKSDEDGVEIAKWELEELLQGTFLEGAPIIATSAHTGEGLDQLKRVLYDIFRELPPRNRQGVARLPLDRAFSKIGFGDVVTGSLWSGSLRVGDPIEVLPYGSVGKVRGLQVHGQAVDVVVPGQRVAVNVSGLDKGCLKRGEALISPVGALTVGERYAVSVTLLQTDPKRLKRKFKATFYQGTQNHQVILNLVGKKDTDTVVFGQLLFLRPVLLCRGDRFLLRDETDQNLLAGGTILTSEETPFKRGRAEKHFQRYEALSGGGEVGRVLQVLAEHGGHCKDATLKKQLGMSQQEWDTHLTLLLESGRIVRVGQDKLWDASKFRELADKVVDLLQKLSAAARWKAGWKPPDIASLLSLKSGKDQGLGEVLEFLAEQGTLKRTGPLYAPAEHEPSLDPAAAKLADRLLALLSEDGFSPRDWDPCLEELVAHDKRRKQQVEEFLLSTDKVVRLSEKLVTTPEVLSRARAQLAASSEDGFTASEARQVLDTSRKFIIPILEWMDRVGWTVRLGDQRKLK